MPFPTDHIALLQQAVRAAHLRNASDRSIRGRFTNALQLWRKLYEATAALRDQNPAFAKRLLPGMAPAAMTVPGLPTIPSGVLSLVDFISPGTATLTVNIAGTLTFAVTPPSGGAPVTSPTTAGSTQQSTTFPATADGIYVVQVQANGVVVATVYVGVFRGLMLDFRQLNRYLAFDFDPSHSPAGDANADLLLAILYALDAALVTGQPALAKRLLTIAATLPKAPYPIALFPRAHGI